MKLQVQHLTLTPEEELEATLQRMLFRAISRHKSASGVYAVFVRGNQLELHSVRGLHEQQIPVSGFFAQMTRSRLNEGAFPDVAGLLGVVERRSGEKKVNVGVVFLEWPSNAWCKLEILLDGEGEILPDTFSEKRAELGDSLPRGLGRWWSAGRRWGGTLRLHQDVVVH